MRGKDNEFLTHEENVGLTKEYSAYLGIKPDTLSTMPKKAGRCFNEKTAAYGFFQEMSRKAKNMEELIAAMLEPDVREKKRRILQTFRSSSPRRRAVLRTA